jgi:proteasome accessory factor A
VPALRLLGGETEYAIALTRPDGTPVEQPPLLGDIMAFARRTLELSSVSPNGRFLSNGGLLYFDSGLHIEWSTPECVSPNDIVRYLRAGDLVVHRLVTDFARRTSVRGEVFVSRCNVDYDSHTAWASHESYQHTCNPGGLPAQLVPFLVSRVVFCGAGGWDVTSPGLVFTLSPRVRFIRRVTGGDSQSERAIFHTKDEPLSTMSTHRLHVACSESLCSDAATWLRFGTTAVVLAAIEAGARPGDDVSLFAPLAALSRIAADPTCQLPVCLATGRSMTAIDIQRHYLRVAESYLHDPRLPEWAGEVCRRWAVLLDALESDPCQMDVPLDWAIKRSIFDRFLTARGFDRRTLTRWNIFLRKHARTDRQSQAFEKALSAARLDREQLQALMEARRRMFEIDMRFAQLGPTGIFSAMDEAGHLAHRLPGVDDFEAAVTEPPTGTRAALRGATVRRLSARRVPYRADWIGVTDLENQRTLDLGNPLETVERWHELPGRQTG